jgi:hypothetical protein
MREKTNQSMDTVCAEESLLHRVATTPAHRCCDYRVLIDARVLDEPRERCLRNELGGQCVAPLRQRGHCRVSV